MFIPGVSFPGPMQGLRWRVRCRSLGCDKEDRPRKEVKNDFIMNGVLMIRASRHTNIVNYIDSFLYKNELWVVSERVDGCLLTDVIRENPLSEGQIAAVSKEIVRGLQHLHKHGVIHRDITGDNVSLCPTSQVKLSMTHNLFSL